MSSNFNPHGWNTSGAGRGQFNTAQGQGQPSSSVPAGSGYGRIPGPQYGASTQHPGYGPGPGGQYSTRGAYSGHYPSQPPGAPPTGGNFSNNPNQFGGYGAPGYPHLPAGAPPPGPPPRPPASFPGGYGGGGNLTYAYIRRQLGFAPLPGKAASTMATTDMQSSGWVFNIESEMDFEGLPDNPLFAQVSKRLETITNLYFRPFNDRHWSRDSAIPLRRDIRHFDGSWDVQVDDDTAFWDKLARTHLHANSLFQKTWSVVPGQPSRLPALEHGPVQPHLFVRDNVPKGQLASIHAFEHLSKTPPGLVHGEMHVEKGIGSAIFSAFNDAPDNASSTHKPTWKCISNTDLRFPIGLKGQRTGGCRPDLALQANPDGEVGVVNDAVIFVAEAKRQDIDLDQAVSQMAFAIHCTLIMLVIEHYSRHGLPFGPLVGDQMNIALPSNFFIFSIYYSGDGMSIYANYPMLDYIRERGTYGWRLHCTLLRQYQFSSATLTYRQRFTVYRAITAIEQHTTNLKHLLCEVDCRPVVQPVINSVGQHISGDYLGGKANFRLFRALHNVDPA
ncbi:hypothetical protein CERSUDRAFT_125379 [Gelatoporia subvermispora B]|uniref:Uncharacterized protein n=1 Tax=Ceriporiopsis subvermispora (strain B) TaxID=914234 RepID=M2QRQ3_CERS8|nr:hypothetical protein CERSUDRAFT_125379 [Gelatoporia subvermispora B]